MSVQAMGWVIEHSPHKGSDLLCLIMIANYANADGSGAYPSMSRLGKDLRMSTRQAVRIVHRLVESGALMVEEGAGPRGTHLMTVVMKDDAPKIIEADSLTPDKLSYPRRSKRQKKQSITTDNMSEENVSQGDMGTDKMSDDKMSPPMTNSDAPLTNCPSTYDIAMSDKPSFNCHIEPSLTLSNDNAVAQLLKPVDVVEVFCRIRGKQVTDLEPRFKSRQFGHAKELLEQGHPPQQVERCLQWLDSQTWRTTPAHLGTVVSEIGNWEVAGEPSEAVARRQATRTADPASQSNANDVDWIGAKYGRAIKHANG